MLAVAFACALIAQQEDLGRLITDLSGEEISRRDEAEAALRRAGAPALPLLEKVATSTNAELAGRAQRLIATIRDDVQRESVLGPVRRVSIKSRGRPLHEILEDLQRQTGFAVTVAQDVADRELTLDTDGPYLDALDRLCAAHGGAHLSARGDGSIEIRAGANVAKPAAYVGPFRIRLESIVLRRSGVTWKTAMVSIVCSVAWQSNVRPLEMGAVLIEDAVDDRGTCLLSEERRKDIAGDRAWHYAHAPSLAALDVLPSEEAMRLTRMKGRLLLSFPLEEAVFEFEPSAKQVGQSRTIGDFVVEFTEWKTAAGAATVVITTRRRDGRPMRGLSSMPVSQADIRILGADGKPLAFTGSGGMLREGTCVWYRSVKVEEGRPPAKVSVRALGRTFQHEVPFEFHDVRLPRW